MKQQKSRYIRAFIEELQSKGEYTFTKDILVKSFPHLMGNSIDQALCRLISKERVARIVRNFFVIIPTEYRYSGAPPANWYIDALMKYLQIPYYVGLLSAAALHGAGHQQPQEFQIVAPITRRPITVGRSYIRFYVRKNIDEMKTQMIKVSTGNMIVGTPETTAFDLVDYSTACGDWNNILTVLQELKESINSEAILNLAKSGEKVSSIQRLGYLLDLCDIQKGLTEPLNKWLNSQKPRYLLFDPSQSSDDAEKNIRWRVIINVNIESDL